MKNKEILNKTPMRGKMSQEELSDKERIDTAKNELNQNVDLNKNLNTPSWLNTTDTGRSMVEMLGVLVVIGILSIVGMMGYQYAMDKYRANDIIHEVNMRGQDIWHRYQNKKLPETIEEWNYTTQTGYPIHIETSPEDALFHVNVDQVESRICKLVLQGKYQSVYAMVVNDGESVIYNGSDLSVCGEENQFVLMIFSFDTHSDYDSGHGLCVTDDDCGAGCFYCSPSHFCESHCAGSKSVCSVSKNACIECETTDQCSEGHICNDIDNICEIPAGACAVGEFRSKNGKCIECSYAGNIIISDQKFGEDILTGQEMCEKCADAGQRRLVETSEDTIYCSKTCTTGISFPSTNDGCISCNNKSSYQYTINTTDQDTLSQCYACPDHYLYRTFVGNPVCGKGLNCETGTFFGIGWGDFNPSRCKSCSDNQGYDFPSGAIEIVQKAKDSCTACPSSAPRYISSNNKCYPQCNQPDESTSIQICQEEGPTSTNCNRHWQGRDNGICYACNTKDSAFVGTSGMYYDMCLNCGRKVNAKGYCYRGDDCAIGTFLGADGACWSCDNNGRVEIENNESSKCSLNCKKDESGQYTATGTIEKRFVHDKYCYKNCGEGYFNGMGGGCVSCSAREAWDLGLRLPAVAEPFISICTACKAPYERMVVQNNYSDKSALKEYCTLKTCPVFSDGKVGYHSAYGRCEPCSTKGMAGWQGPNQVPEEDCIACGNRFMLHNYCVLFDPGNYGVCNSLDNIIPDYIDEQLKQAAQPYLQGSYDGKKFRSQSGSCSSCDATANITVGNDSNGIAQCKSCGNRRFSNGTCIYGLCSESGTFLRESDWSCIKCGTGGKKVNIPSSAASQNLCAGCDGYRSMTTGSSETKNLKTYCIKKCTDFEFEDINANCYDESSQTPSIEIGTDSDSIARCNQMSNRTVITDSESGKVYCNLINNE